MHDDQGQSSNTLDVLEDMRPLTSMSGQVATPEQQTDLLGIGKLDVKGLSQINFFVLKDPSAVVPREEEGQTPYLCLN